IQQGSARPPGMQATLPTDNCTIDSDTLEVAAKAAEWTDDALAALAAGAGQIYADNNALDGIRKGTLTPRLVAHLGAAALAAPCAHIHLYNQAMAQGQVLDALKGYLKQLTPAPKPTPGPTTSRGGGGGDTSGAPFTVAPNRGGPGTRVSVGHIKNCPPT